MVEKKAFTEQELDQKIKELAPEWKKGVSEKGIPFIYRVHHAPAFMAGIDFVHKVAEAAEAENHHPTSSSTTGASPSGTGPTPLPASPWPTSRWRKR